MFFNSSDGSSTQCDLNTSVLSNFARATASPVDTSFQNTTHLSHHSGLGTLDRAVQQVEHYLNTFASSTDFSQVMNLAFGNNYDTKEAISFANAWAGQDFSQLPQIKIYSGDDLTGAYGAFSVETNTIYLSSDYLTNYSNNVDALTGVIMEEIGHYIDSRLNPTDSPGDEGDIFSRLVRGQDISAEELVPLKAEDDHGFITLNGQLTAVEFASPSNFGINLASVHYNRAGNKFAAANRTGGTRLWCTDFAFGRALEKGLIQQYSGIGGKISGNAGVWDDQAGSWSRQARANSFVVWDANQGGAGSVGHVAFVERVNSNGSFVVSEANWGSARMSFNSRTISPGTSAFSTAKFIHLGSAPNNNEALIRQLYQDVHNREPDAGGLQYWMGQMSSGMTLSQVRTAFANSPEARNNINTAYRNILLRDAEPSGLQFHLNLLANGSTLRGIYEGISLSNEARSQFWVAQYFNNTDRTGAPVFAQSFGRTNTGFNRNWGTGSPSSWVNADNFSARIFGRVSFGAGLQEIRVQADDGVRVRIGGRTIIDRLVDQPFVLNTGTFNAGNGGTFNVEIEYYERGGAAALNFSSRSLTPPTPSDNAGNALFQARNLGTLFANSQGRYNFTTSDFVGNVDSNDYYRFSLSNRSTFNLTLGNLTADANLQLIRDTNNNGVVDSGEVIAGSYNMNFASDSISRILDSGTYFVRVYQGAQTANTNYSLNFLADLNWGTISGINGFGQTLTHQIGFQRVDGSSQAISSSRPTWVIIHGMDNSPTSPDIGLLSRAIDRYEVGDQVFALDWSSASRSNSNQASIPLPGIGASWIEAAAHWASQQLRNWGIASTSINLAGHSLGAYVSAEIAERISGGVNRLIAFDPAKSLPGGYESETVDFRQHSQWSWGFYTSSFGNSGRTTTADDSFTIGFGKNDPQDNHGNGLDLFASMLGRSDSVSSLFKLNKMGQRPWMLNQFDEFGMRGNPLGGNYEGRIEAKLEGGRWVPKTFLYRNASAKWWETNTLLWA